MSGIKLQASCFPPYQFIYRLFLISRNIYFLNLKWTLDCSGDFAECGYMMHGLCCMELWGRYGHALSHPTLKDLSLAYKTSNLWTDAYLWSRNGTGAHESVMSYYWFPRNNIIRTSLSLGAASISNWQGPNDSNIYLSGPIDLSAITRLQITIECRVVIRFK